MISEYCPMGVLVRDCEKDKRRITCNKQNYSLRDNTGQDFPIHQDHFCRSLIYNSKILCVMDRLDEVYKSGINILRLDFTFEKNEDIKEILDSHINIIKNNFKMDQDESEIYEKLKKEGITKGHYFRGVE